MHGTMYTISNAKKAIGHHRVYNSSGCNLMVPSGRGSLHRCLISTIQDKNSMSVVQPINCMSIVVRYTHAVLVILLQFPYFSYIIEMVFQSSKNWWIVV